MMTWDHPMIVLIDQEIWLKTKKLIKTEKLQYSTIQNESDQRMQHWKLSKKSQKSMNIKIQQMRLWIPRCKSQRTNKLLLPVYVYRTSIESFRHCIFLSKSSKSELFQYQMVSFHNENTRNHFLFQKYKSICLNWNCKIRCWFCITLSII